MSPTIFLNWVLSLPSPPEPIGNYVPYRLGGGLLFLSGVGPRDAAGGNVTGEVARR